MAQTHVLHTPQSSYGGESSHQSPDLRGASLIDPIELHVIEGRTPHLPTPSPSVHSEELGKNADGPTSPLQSSPETHTTTSCRESVTSERSGGVSSAADRVIGPDPYNELAGEIVNDLLHSWTIFRRFDKLAVRNLLYLESELLELEHRLKNLDDDEDGFDLDESWVLMHSWPMHKLNPVDPRGKDSDIVERAEQRRNLVFTIRKTLKDYHEALKLTGEVFSLQQPYHGDVKIIRRIITGDVNPATCEQGSAFAKDMMFADSMNERLDNEDDLCILAPKMDRDPLTRMLETRFSRAFQNKETHKTNMKNYNIMKRCVRLASTFLAVIWLVCAIVALYFWRSDGGRIVLFAVLTLFFALFVALLTTARTHDIYAAIATFAAVLVVFIGTALNQSDQTNNIAPLESSRFQDGLSTLTARGRAETARPSLVRRQPAPHLHVAYASSAADEWPANGLVVALVFFCGVCLFSWRRKLNYS